MFQRTVRGDLFLSIQDQQEGGETDATTVATRNFCGRISMDEELMPTAEEDGNHLCSLSYTIKPPLLPDDPNESVTQSDVDDPWFVDVDLDTILTDCHLKDCIDNEESGIAGRIYIISKRVTLPWIPRESDSEDFSLEDDFISPFSSLQEAETLAQESVLGKRSFIKRLSPTLNDKTATCIAEFASSAPPPVFFLEPGALWLQMDWNDDFRQDAVVSIVIARKKKQQPE